MPQYAYATESHHSVLRRGTWYTDTTSIIRPRLYQRRLRRD